MTVTREEALAMIDQAYPDGELERLAARFGCHPDSLKDVLVSMMEQRRAHEKATRLHPLEAKRSRDAARQKNLNRLHSRGERSLWASR